MKGESGFSNRTADAWTSHSSRSCQPLALVLSDAPSADLGVLTSQRCQAALPFAGKYRLIDFALSNCVNSGIENVGVITQYQPRSLHTHLAYGRPWNLDRREGRLTLLHPYQVRTGMGWYAGTADAIYQNQEFIFHYHANQVLILAGGVVGCMDLSALAAQHRKTKADLTVAAAAIEGKAAGRHYTLIADCEGWARTLVPPGSDRPGPLAAVGVLLFSTDALSWRLSEDAQQPNSTHDLLHDVIPRMIQAGDRVMVFHHAGYWNSLQTAHDYWQAQMDLLSESPDLNLQDAAWPIRGRFEVRPPTLITTGAKVSHSLFSDGCVVGGTVECSVLSPGVHVASGAIVRNAVVMHNTTIEERARVENVILDMDVIVGSRAQVGQLRQPLTLSTSVPGQLTIVGRGIRVPTCEVVRPDYLSNDWCPSAQRKDVSETRIHSAQMS